MALFLRPASPKNALADLLLMFSPDRPHRWALLGVSAALTFILVWAFVLDSIPPKRERQIIYVESWMADRKDSDIIRRQIADLSTYEADVEKQQAQYQKLADMTNIDYREEAEKSKKQRVAVIAAVQKQLESKLANALAREAIEADGKAASDAIKSHLGH